MRRPLPISLVLPLVLCARSAQADLDREVAGGRGLGSLKVSVRLLPRPSVQIFRCGVGGCGAAPVHSSDLTGFDGAHAAAEEWSLGNGRSILHVRVPAEGELGAAGRAWEGLFGARTNGDVVLFAGPTGLAPSGDEDRSASMIQRYGETVVVGEARNDVRLCGEPPTLLAPRALDPESLEFRSAAVQRLPLARRDAAPAVVVKPLHGAMQPAIGQLLAPAYASVGSPSTAADGNLATRWIETRSGDGAGEFLLFRTPVAVPLERLSFVPVGVLSPKGGTDGSLGRATSPKSIFVVTDSAAFDVAFPEDAALHPGDAYELTFPAPVSTSCLGVVLDEAYEPVGRDAPEVGFAEIAAYGPFDEAGTAAAAAALKGASARSVVAAEELKRGGDRAARAVEAAYGTLDALGRVLAIDVAIAAGSCETASALLVKALSDPEAEASRKATDKLARCGKAATPALLRGLTSEAARAKVAPLVAITDPRAALEPLASLLGDGAPAVQKATRDAAARAAAHADPNVLARLLVAAEATPAKEVEVLRAFEGSLGRLGPAAKIAEALATSGDAAVRYRLTGPLLALARGGDPAALRTANSWLTSDASWPVRAELARQAAAIPGLEAGSAHAFTDPSPRVREAALSSATEARPAGNARAEASASDLALHDDWTFVREAAFGLLRVLPSSPRSRATLQTALGDVSPRIRIAALGAIAGIATTDRASYAAHASKVTSILEDPAELPAVRAAAAHAIGQACDESVIGDLTELAQRSAFPVNEADTILGLAATRVLGRLHPADLAKRLASLRAATSSDIRHVAALALGDAKACK